MVPSSQGPQGFRGQVVDWKSSLGHRLNSNYTPGKCLIVNSTEDWFYEDPRKG
jgi:hypothetical protein